MPKYTRGNGKFVKRDLFENVSHLQHWLYKTDSSHPIWKAHFAPTYKAHPHSIARAVLSELRRKNRGKTVGGGITETLHFIATEAADALGWEQLKEFIGTAPEHRELPNEDRIFATAVEETYKPIEERRSQIEDLTRLPRYDTDRYSVWQQTNGQLLVSVHGTKMNSSDLTDDLAIVGGGKPMSTELNQLFSELDADGINYDVAAHSLGTQFVVNSTHENLDKAYLFNPASAPTQDGEFLESQINNPQYQFYINPSDVVSKALYNKMDDNALQSNFISEPNYSPLAAHSMDQWTLDETEEGQE